MKMKLYAAIICSLLSVTALGQSQDSVKAGRWRIGFTFSPDYAHRILSVPLELQYVDHMSRYEVPKMGFTTGAGLTYQLSEKWRWETGLFYTNKGTLLEWDVYYSNYTAQVESLEDYIRFYHIYSYLEAPMKLSFHFKPQRNVHRYLVFGGAAELLFSAKDRVVTTYSSGRKRTDFENLRINEYNPVNVSLCIGYGWDVKINEQLSAVVEPCYTQFLIQQFKDEKINEYMYSFGLKLGVYYRLKAK